jgi:hypothetical protein
MINVLFGGYCLISYLVCGRFLLIALSPKSTVGERIFYGVAWALSPVAVFFGIKSLFQEKK